MPKSRPKLNEDQLSRLRAEAIAVTQRAQRSRLVTRQAVQLAQVVWLTIRQHGFTPANTLKQREGFRMCTNPQWLVDERSLVEVDYYREDDNEAHCGEAMERIHGCLRRTGLRMEMTYKGNSKRNPKPIVVIHILPPHEHQLEVLYRYAFPGKA